MLRHQGFAQTGNAHRHQPCSAAVRCVNRGRQSVVRVRSEAPVLRKSVVALGEALFDLIADEKGVRREDVKSWTPFAGGAPANVATSLAKLGLDVVFISALGRDSAGDSLFDLLKESGVRLDGIQRRDEPTRDVYVVRDASGDREFAGFGRPTQEYCDAHLDADQMPLDKIKNAALLITGTLGLAYPGSRKAMHAAVQAAKEGGCEVLVDVNWRPVFWNDHAEARTLVMEYLKKADLIKLSDADLLWLLDIPFAAALANPCAVLQRFPKATGMLITAGAEGATYCFRTDTKTEHSGFVPCFKVEVMDTTGAGDAFTAGLVYRMMQVGSIDALCANAQVLKEAVVFASAAGALTTTNRGAIGGQPRLKEVETLFQESKGWCNFW